LLEEQEQVQNYNKKLILMRNSAIQCFVVYLINEKDKGSIQPELASVVQEHLTLTMTKILKFYHKSSEVSKLFELEVGDWCTSDKVCYISDSEVMPLRNI
jgi:hypothetical protein